MHRPVIVLNDPTSHGGKVMTASSSMEIDGMPVALLHDLVSCPKHGPNKIIECEVGYQEGGRGVVVHHCKTECGAVVRATQTGMDF